MRSQNKLKIILPIILVSSSAFIIFQVKNNLTPSQISDPGSKMSINSKDQNISPTPFQKLTVLENRCRGCGKCVRIDPSHFEITSQIATVISSTNLDSTNLKLAINNCPAQAIVLE